MQSLVGKELVKENSVLMLIGEPIRVVCTGNKWCHNLNGQADGTNIWSTFYDGRSYIHANIYSITESVDSVCRDIIFPVNFNYLRWSCSSPFSSSLLNICAITCVNSKLLLSVYYWHAKLSATIVILASTKQSFSASIVLDCILVIGTESKNFVIGTESKTA